MLRPTPLTLTVPSSPASFWTISVYVCTVLPHSFFFKLIQLFTYFGFDLLGFDCLAHPFSSCKQKLFSSCSAQASHCSGFSCCETQALGTWASVVAALGLNSPMAGGVLVPRPGIEPIALHWQAGGPPGKFCSQPREAASP